MAITGKIVFIGQLQTGTSKVGKPWKKQEYVLETAGQYPKKVAFSIMNERIDSAAIQMGQQVEVEVDAQSREYNGKWYTDLTAWRINNQGFVQPVQAAPVYQQQPPAGYQAPSYPQNPAPQNNSFGDGVPF